MKYYCKNCGCEVIPGKPSERSAALEIVCPWCGRKILSISPARETVAQWEARRGEKYPDTAPAYYFSGRTKSWRCAAHDDIFYDNNKHQIVATNAGAPPDDWRLEQP